jgi:hypothetical protein
MRKDYLPLLFVLGMALASCCTTETVLSGLNSNVVTGEIGDSVKVHACTPMKKETAKQLLIVSDWYRSQWFECDKTTNPIRCRDEVDQSYWEKRKPVLDILNSLQGKLPEEQKIVTAAKREGAGDNPLPAVAMSKNRDQKRTPMHSSPKQGSEESSTPPKILQVSYATPFKVFTDVTIGPSPEEPYSDTYIFYKVGDITGGPYKGGQLVLVYDDSGGPCKGSGCDQPGRARFILSSKTAVFLPRISQSNLYYGTYDGSFNPFQKFGFTLKRDDTVTIPILEYPKTLMGDSSRQLLQLAGERDGKPDTTTLIKIASNKIFGPIYTTKPGFNVTRSFYYDPFNKNSNEPVDIEDCVGSDCFLNNGFYVFRPDGTFLQYYYEPDFSMSDVLQSPASDYDYQTPKGCNKSKVDYSSIIPDAVVHNGGDPVIIGYTHTKDPVYKLKDESHVLLKEFYQNYQQTFTKFDQERNEPYFLESPPGRGTAYATLQTYAQFIAAKPILLWRDPFGRLIRFSNASFLPPMLCEPIIYLYPEQEQEIEVRLNPKVHITGSTPPYSGQWNVLAKPSGEIVNLADNKGYPYLFWEGWSLTFNMPRKGFIVERSDVSNFLADMLPRLGLNDEEKNDFIRVWAPRLSDAPYYFITFISQEDIDKIAPLEISPAPRTIIRVLMDYRPLSSPVEVEPPILSAPSPRSGFTVIEWGGLKR